MLPFPRNISPVPIFYIFLRYWFMIVIRALMFLMPETVPSVCSLNTDSDFTLEGFNNDLRAAYIFIPLVFWIWAFEIKSFKAFIPTVKNAERIQTGFLNTPPPVCHWLTKQIALPPDSRHWLSHCCHVELIGMLKKNRIFLKKTQRQSVLTSWEISLDFL